MATSWYLLNRPHDQISGYEDDALYDFAEESFQEILDTQIASTVDICNYDLSEIKTVQVVIQRNVQDTVLNALNRHILAPIGTIKAGMYVKYKDRYWLIVGLVDDNTMYEKGVMTLCNWHLSWLNDKGEVVQRWANVTSASQYNNGETNMQYYFVRSNQLLVILPDDDESTLLDSGRRFIIDDRCSIYENHFDDTVTSNTENKLITYELTRSDTVLYDYIDSGYTEFLASEDEQHDSDGYYVINGTGYWLCDVPDTVKTETATATETTTVAETTSGTASSMKCEIVSDYDVVYANLDPTVFTANFYDRGGNLIPRSATWTIVCDFGQDLELEEFGEQLSISVKNPRLINKSFDLILSASGYEEVTKTITIRAFI